ncbi:MAG: ubiquinol-cytochrome C chaperone [Alphaproteobacteria bacterium]|nr:ubiquinol-cytochrome C chaperone [Alphaproteobacteria bacterium]
MISFPFRRPAQDRSIDALYGMIVAQARSPEFYRGYGVADTVTGRFEMLVLHLALLMRRLRAGQPGVGEVGQRLFDRFCRDMDDNFREMGIGDLGVPKEMRKVAEAYYGRSKVYDAALDRADMPALLEAVGRNVFGASEPPAGARALAAYMRDAAGRLAGADASDLLAGRSPFPDPAAAREPEGMPAP